jgi:outer membrane biosynthesis protein TonB
LIPAAPGTGLKAGSSLRAVLELAGYENILSKIVGANNKLNVALTTFKALSTYKHADHFSAKSGKKNEKTEEKEGTEEKKTPVKKTATKKPAAKKTPAKKTATKKTSTKKTPAKKKPAAKKETEKDT